MRLTYLIPTIAVCGFTGCWKVVSNPRSATTATYAKPPDLPPLARKKKKRAAEKIYPGKLVMEAFSAPILFSGKVFITMIPWFPQGLESLCLCWSHQKVRFTSEPKKEALQLEHKTQHLRFLQDTTLLLWSTAQICLGQSSTRFRPNSCLKWLVLHAYGGWLDQGKRKFPKKVGFTWVFERWTIRFGEKSFPFRSFSEEALSIQTMMLVACLRSPAAAMDKAPWPDLKDTTLKMKTKHESTPFEKENRGNHSPPTPSKPPFQIHSVNWNLVGQTDSSVSESPASAWQR